MLQTILSQQPTAKRLFLSLGSARAVDILTISQLIKVGALFGIGDGAVRVAAARLVKQGFLEIRSRGVYAIGPRGRALSETARAWTGVEDRLGAWTGGWLAAHVSHLSRADKTALRTRERAFRLNGFKELSSGLWIRPDNFAETACETKRQLVQLGLEDTAILIAAHRMVIPNQIRLEALWRPRRLETQYSECIALMEESDDRLSKMEPPAATREAFLIGEHVIRQIIADPLLPEGMIDAARRKSMIDAMIAYNKLGAEITMNYLETP